MAPSRARRKRRDRARALRGNVDRSTAEVLRELADAKARGLSDVVFTGGEPTIRKDLPLLLSQAAALGSRLHVQTNARLFKHDTNYGAFSGSVEARGDDLVPAPRVNATHAVTIQARPSNVWPWLAQIGQGRGDRC